MWQQFKKSNWIKYLNTKMKSQKSFKECEILNLGVRKAIPTESRSTNHKLKNNKYHLNIKEILLLIKKPTNLKYK